MSDSVVRKKPPWNILLGIGVSAIALWFSFRGVDFDRLSHSLSQLSATSLLMLVLVNLAFLFIRAYRWQWLLRSVKPIKLAPVFHLTQIGALANNVLPLRIGEVVRAMLLKKRFDVSGAQALGNILLERIVDLVALMLMLLVVLLSGRLPVQFLKYARFTIVIVGGFIVVVMIALWVYRNKIDTGKHEGRGVGGIFSRLASGLHAMYLWRITVPAIVLTVVMWLISALTFLVFGDSFPMEITILEAISVSVLTAVGATIPAAPGSVGTYHLSCKLGLMAYGMSSEQALVIAFVTHIIAYLTNNITGAISMVVYRVHWRDLIHTKSSELSSKSS